ncbi:hypothetical protein [Lacticaseibacillus paracasei]|uniref:hypothetical protein n=1 Tax=Lacticaseibacillus paracasei TaxID=1597 RepID=UPI001320551A|nr:hypothetical protein [Lacticaseibacillus paracasei]QHC81181.1 hypothetical protein F5J09_04840 [Lacticaseibacillus paracasei]
MSNETKRDVLVDAVDALADAQASGGNIGHQDANLFMAEYDNALPDETEKQKNCPYCHEVDPQSKHAHYGKAMSDKTEYFDFIRKHKLYRRVKARIKSPENDHPKLCVTQMNRFKEVSVVLDKEIKYCPICGRKL